MIGLLFSAWLLVLKRAASDRLIVAAAFVTVLLAATLLAAGPIYSESVALSGLRRTLGDAAVQDRGLEVSARVTADRYSAANRKADERIWQALGTGTPVYRSAMSDSYALPNTEGGPRRALAVFAFYEGIQDHAALVSGTWPAAAESRVLEAALPTATARELGLAIGDQLVLAATADPSRTVAVRVTGTYRIRDLRDVFWWASTLETEGMQTVNFTTYGPFVVAERSFHATIADDARTRWRAALPIGRVSIGDLDGLRDRLATLAGRLASEPRPPRYEVAGGLQAVLDKADRSLLVARSGVLIPSVQLGILAAAALLFLAALLVERRLLESAIIRSRGGGGDKVATLAMMEGALLAVPAALAAPWLAALSLRVLNYVGPLAAVELDLHTHVNRESYVLAFLAGLACIAALSLPALRAAPITLTVSERGRPPAKGLFRRAGLDLVLAALALLAYWQLRRYGGPVVETVQGRLGVDPFLIAAPALGLLAGAMLTLRIVPAAAFVAERAVAAARGTVPALGTRELARRPRRYSRAALLLTLALAIGLFASAYSRTWLRSQADQADYAAAADVRVRPSERTGSIPSLLLAHAYTRLDGVREALPVFADSFELTRSSGETSLLAVDAARVPAVLRFRRDLADRPLTSVLAPLAARRPRIASVPLPGRPTRMQIQARVTAPDILFRGQRVPALLFAGTHPTLYVVVKDADGLLYRFPGGELPPNGTARGIVVDFSQRLADGSRGLPAYPLALVSFELQTRLAFRGPVTARLTIARVRTSEGENAPFVDVPAPASRWAVDVPSTENLDEAPEVLAVGKDEKNFYSLDFSTGSWASFFERAPVTFTATPGPNPSARAVAAVVTDRFRERTGTGVGEAVPLAAAGQGPALAVTGVVHGFPTLPAEASGAIVDLPTFVAANYLSDGTVIGPTEWWIETTDGRSSAVARRLQAPPYTSNEVVDRVARAHALTTDPVALGISGALLLGFAAAAVFAVVGFAVSAAVSAAERTTEFAVLRSIGVSARQLSGTLALEGGLVVALALSAGTALGAGLAWLVLPFVSLTGEGGRPFPDVLVVFPWRTAAWLDLAMLAALGVVVAVQIQALRRLPLASALRAGEDR